MFNTPEFVELITKRNITDDRWTKTFDLSAVRRILCSVIFCYGSDTTLLTAIVRAYHSYDHNVRKLCRPTDMHKQFVSVSVKRNCRNVGKHHNCNLYYRHYSPCYNLTDVSICTRMQLCHTMNGAVKSQPDINSQAKVFKGETNRWFYYHVKRV